MARWTTGGGAELERIAAELDGWRRSPERGRGIPEGIWRDVVALAQAHGVYRVVRSLRLNYESVKRRVATLAVAPKRRDNAPAFLERVLAVSLRNPAAPRAAGGRWSARARATGGAARALSGRRNYGRSAVPRVRVPMTRGFPDPLSRTLRLEFLRHNRPSHLFAVQLFAVQTGLAARSASKNTLQSTGFVAFSMAHWWVG